VALHFLFVSPETMETSELITRLLFIGLLVATAVLRKPWLVYVLAVLRIAAYATIS
jgi:hypothetical protein